MHRAADGAAWVRMWTWPLWLGCLSACGGGGAAGTVAASTAYTTPIYSESQLARYTDQVYSTRPNAGGLQYSASSRRAAEAGAATLDLHLDVVVPPNATAQRPQPLLVWVHGGGFIEGAKEDVMPQALTYARAGFVVASVNYRLAPVAMQDTLDEREMAIRQSTEDAMNAVRYLKTHADAYHIDVSRTAMLGMSAGGTIALFNAIEFDTLAGVVSDYPGVSARVDAVVDTAGTYRDATYDSDSFLRYDAGDSPVLLLHANPTDGVTGTTWEANAVATQQRIERSGNRCTLVAQPDGSHTADLSLTGPYAGSVRPFLAEHLRLASLP